MNQPLPIDRIPHQPPMRWIHSAVRTGEDEAVCEARLPGACGKEGTAPMLLGLEILAQAAAVLLAAFASEALPEGRLLQVRESNWSENVLPLDVPLEVRVKRLQSNAMGLHRFSGNIVSSSGETLLEADFSLLTNLSPS